MQVFIFEYDYITTTDIQNASFYIAITVLFEVGFFSSMLILYTWCWKTVRPNITFNNEMWQILEISGNIQFHWYKLTMIRKPLVTPNYICRN